MKQLYICSSLCFKNTLNYNFQIDVETIQKLSFEFTELEFFPLAFKPIIDDFSTTPFVPKDPWELIESGKFNQVIILYTLIYIKQNLT